MDSGQRGINPVAMTIINSGKEYWPSQGSNKQLPVLKSCALPTEHNYLQNDDKLTLSQMTNFRLFLTVEFADVNSNLMKTADHSPNG